MKTNLPYNSRSPKKPIMVTDCAKEVKAIGGVVWLLQKQAYGFILCCEIGSLKFRVVLPILTGSNTEKVPEEKIPSFVVANLNELRNWLQSLKQALN